MNNFILARSIAILYRKSQIYWGNALQSSDITIAEYPILIHLFSKDGVTQNELAKAAALDKSSVTRSVQSLLNHGYIERKKNNPDKRCNCIYLTEKGRNTQPLIEKIIREWDSILTDCLTGEEKDEAYRLLNLMASEIIKEDI